MAFEMSTFQSPSEGSVTVFSIFPDLHLFYIKKLKLYFTSIAVTNTSEETSCCFNFTDFKILIFFLRKTVGSHLSLLLLDSLI